MGFVIQPSWEGWSFSNGFYGNTFQVWEKVQLMIQQSLNMRLREKVAKILKMASKPASKYPCEMDG